jgi:hypothetical protein
MFDWVPNPADWLGGDDRHDIPQGPERFEQSQQGVPEAGASIRDTYRARAFEQIGAENEDEFNSMDPLARNTRITGAYADMYMSDSDTNKWAGMAAYASDLVGVGIGATDAVDGLSNPIFPGLDLEGGMDLAGVDNDGLNELLAEGNAGVYDDLMWQHMAMQEGGIETMRAAAEAGEIPAEQLAGWETITAGRGALDEARASGDEEAIAAANNEIWAGNNALLQYEQQVFLQELVYDDSPEARALFDRISPGMVSPVPGGTSFINHRDAQGESIGGDADIGDVDQRWDWIENSMAPEYRNREENESDSMQRDMRRFSANANTGMPGLPMNTEDPTDFELPEMPDIPYLPAIERGVERGVDSVIDTGREVINDPIGSAGRALDTATDLGGRAIDTISDNLPELPDMEDVDEYLPWNW